MGDQLTGVSLARSFGLVGTVSIVDDSPFVYGLAVELSIESHYAFDGMRSAQPLSCLGSVSPDAVCASGFHRLL